jgi:hypothetical protein
MRKVILTKVIQTEAEFFVMVEDPRVIAKIRKKFTAGESQDVQRPWKESKVKEISRYVAGKMPLDGLKALGIIPNSPILNIKKPLEIVSESIEIIDSASGTPQTIKQYFIMLPDKEEEYEKYEKCIEIIDGQHRIIAFDDKYIDTSFDQSKA